MYIFYACREALWQQQKLVFLTLTNNFLKELNFIQLAVEVEQNIGFDFLEGKTTQRESLIWYFDLFSYQLMCNIGKHIADVKRMLLFLSISTQVFFGV